VLLALLLLLLPLAMDFGGAGKGNVLLVLDST
jgi:hypothetical protein